MPRYGPGRRRGRRWITKIPETTYFRPLGIPPQEMNVTYLTLEELEALRLVDLEGLTQEEAAAQMGVSRKTLWNDLQSARKKVVTALVNGQAIHIMGGNYALRSSSYASLPPFQFGGAPVGQSRYPAIGYIDDKIEEKAKQIFQLLPKIDCGKCGYPSCTECARAIATGSAPPDACQIRGIEIRDKVREILEEKE